MHCVRVDSDVALWSGSSSDPRRCSERLMRQATSVSRDTLLSLGTCFGKFTKSGRFRLHITALDYISQYAKVRLTLSGCFRPVLLVHEGNYSLAGSVLLLRSMTLMRL